MDFEKKISRLEEIVQTMEKGELSLDDSLKMFEEGTRLSRECHAQLKTAEQRVEELLAVNADGTAETKEFESRESDN